jgi:hypothetical protein
MALVYLVDKPQVSGRIAKWLLMFFEYDFIVMYKPCKSHVILDALLRLPDITEPIVCLIKPQMQVCFIQGLNG